MLCLNTASFRMYGWFKHDTGSPGEVPRQGYCPNAWLIMITTFTTCYDTVDKVKKAYLHSIITTLSNLSI